VSIRRDYKPAANRQRRRQHTRRHGLLVLTLVLIGLFGGLLAYIKGDRNPPPAAPAVAAPAQRPAPAAVPAPPKVAAPEPASEPAPTRPKYDFYTELPKRQVEIPPDDPAPRPALRPAPPRNPPANEPPRKPAALQKSASTPNMAATAGSRPASGHSGE
jgi:hypothetical protein